MTVLRSTLPEGKRWFPKKSPTRTGKSERGSNPTRIASREAANLSVARSPWADEGKPHERVAA